MWPGAFATDPSITREQDPMKNNSGSIPAHGNYRALLSYQKAEIIYDFTYRFCHRFLANLDRTNDQIGPSGPIWQTKHCGR